MEHSRIGILFQFIPVYKVSHRNLPLTSFRDIIAGRVAGKKISR